jgi:hypothetical protein
VVYFLSGAQPALPAARIPQPGRAAARRPKLATLPRPRHRSCDTARDGRYPVWCASRVSIGHAAAPISEWHPSFYRRPFAGERVRFTVLLFGRDYHISAAPFAYVSGRVASIIVVTQEITTAAERLRLDEPPHL